RLRQPELLDDELASKLSTVLPRTSRVPDHWRPMHGDLSPWNLRRGRDGSFLIDWEDATWGPPRADRVYFSITGHAALGGPAPSWGPADDEAREYWRAVITARSGGDEDSATQERLLTILG
ncbi:MAG: phosphotransferase, partial [Candidatus Nanopelagicales bacterium]